MKAFISYSHVDQRFLERLHVHFAPLQREELITTWTDNDILAGGKLDKKISDSLANSKLFIALLSPDYISSNYCYEKEFKNALEMQEKNQIIVIPVIVEDCDWLNTPFQKFKALPKDGKPISAWNNENTAYLNIIQEIRNLITVSAKRPIKAIEIESEISSKNYKIKKDFDSIQKLEFQENSFKEIKKIIEINISELGSLENINAKITKDDSNVFEAILVNRNMIGIECILSINIEKEKNQLYQQLHNSEYGLNVVLKKSNGSKQDFSYSLNFDEYNMFWKTSSFHSFNQTPITEKLTSKQITEEIWEMWLKEVGIEF